MISRKMQIAILGQPPSDSWSIPL